MNDRRDEERADRGPRDRDDRNQEERGRDGSDTRFLQLEMSRVLYAEAEGVTKQAFRELLLDAAKAHLRERFGETITRLAQMAIDEFVIDIEASLDIEDQIQRRGEASGGTPDRMREALAGRQSARSRPTAERPEGRASASRRRRRRG
jgi:hypothetical protein